STDAPFALCKLDFGMSPLQLLEQFPLEKFFGCTALVGYQTIVTKSGHKKVNGVQPNTMLFCWELKRDVFKGEVGALRELSRGLVYSGRSLSRNIFYELVPRMVGANSG
ncbi:unnamed protein product, partial [Amoebophrya sp. A25]